MTFGLVDVGYSLPEGQAVKWIFFAPCNNVYFSFLNKEAFITQQIFTKGSSPQKIDIQEWKLECNN